MAKKINKKISKNTFVIDGLINSDEKISKIIKKAKKKNIKSVSLVIDYNEDKKINKKKVNKKSKITKIEDKKDTKIYPLIEVKNESIENKNQEKLEITKKDNKNLDNFKDINKEKKISASEQKINNNLQKIDIKKINDKFVDINKTITKLIEELKQDNKAKSISIFISCDKKEKIKNKNKKKNKKRIANKKVDLKKENKEVIKKEEKIINNKENNVKVDEIIKDPNIPKIEKENIEIKDLDTEELRILKIKTSKYFKISNPFKSNNSKKNSKGKKNS